MKDIKYDYVNNGYRFIGWQNGWYTNPPEEYTNCVQSKHEVDDIQHNMRGSENTVSCDICKIFWKYDCSD